jgi:hypothetical protein
MLLGLRGPLVATVPPAATRSLLDARCRGVIDASFLRKPASPSRPQRPARHACKQLWLAGPATSGRSQFQSKTYSATRAAVRPRPCALVARRTKGGGGGRPTDPGSRPDRRRTCAGLRLVPCRARVRGRSGSLASGGRGGDRLTVHDAQTVPGPRPPVGLRDRARAHPASCCAGRTIKQRAEEPAVGSKREHRWCAKTPF